MKVKSEIDCKCTARATLTDDGELSLRVSASAVYNPETGATTSVDIEVPDAERKAVAEALAAAVAACEAAVRAQIMDAIHVSRKVARDHGEMK